MMKNNAPERSSRRGRGEGGVRQRSDGRWEATVDHGMVDGKRQRRYLYGKTKREVQQKLSQAKRQHEAGLPAPDERLTVAAFLTDWLQTKKTSLKPSTWHRYGEYVEHHIAPGLGHLRLAKLAPHDVQRLLDEKQAQGASPRTVQHIRAVLRSALNQALRWDMVMRNAAALASPPRVPQQDQQSLTPQQARAFLLAARGDRLEAFYLLALLTGMRQGELLGLRWSDVDVERAVLQVRRTVRRLPGIGWQEGEPKSARSRRAVPLLPIAVDALRAHRLRQLDERRALSSIWDKRDLVFCNTVGHLLEPQNVLRRSFVPLLERADLPRIRFHDLRHSVASLLTEGGVPPFVVMEILGHSQVATTHGYTHISSTLARSAMQTLGRLLAEE